MALLPAANIEPKPLFQPGWIGPRQLIFLLSVVGIFLLVSFFILSDESFNIFRRIPSQIPPVDKEQIENLTANCEVDEQQAKQYLIDNKALSGWAQAENIQITAEEKRFKEMELGGSEPVSDCLKLMAKVDILRDKLSQNIVKFREGKFVIVNFRQYYPSNFYKSDLPEEELVRLRQEERAYADTLIGSIHQDLKANKMTFEQAMEKVNSDSKVGVESWYSTTTQSSIFDAKDYIEKGGILHFEDVRQRVDTTALGQFSEPFILKIYEDVENPQPIESAWLIVKVENMGKGYGGDFDTLISQIREKYK